MQSKNPEDERERPFAFHSRHDFADGGPHTLDNLVTRLRLQHGGILTRQDDEGRAGLVKRFGPSSPNVKNVLCDLKISFLTSFPSAFGRPKDHFKKGLSIL
jgi:hypothetical protein